MDFGLDAMVAVTASAATSAPSQPDEGGVAGDASAFAAHLADADEAVAPDSVADQDPLTADPGLAPPQSTGLIQPLQMLLQGFANAASGAAEVAGEGTPASAPETTEPTKPAPLSLAGEPELAPTSPAAPNAAAAETEAATPAPPPSPPTDSMDFALPANGTAQAVSLASVAKPAAKSTSGAKSDATETAAPATPAAAAPDDVASAAEKHVDAGATRDPRVTAPHADRSNARTEPAFALGADGSAQPAPTPASQTSSALPSVASAAPASHSAPIASARAAEAAPAATQVAQEIVRRFDGDTTRFEVRLDPPELGRVEVRLEVSRDNKVSATVVADSPQTLVELARHARDLQSSLQSAGLDLADSGLSFDLRDNGREAHGARGNGDRGLPSASAGALDELTAPRARGNGLDPWRGRTLDVTA